MAFSYISKTLESEKQHSASQGTGYAIFYPLFLQSWVSQLHCLMHQLVRICNCSQRPHSEVWHLSGEPPPPIFQLTLPSQGLARGYFSPAYHTCEFLLGAVVLMAGSHPYGLERKVDVSGCPLSLTPLQLVSNMQSKCEPCTLYFLSLARSLALSLSRHACFSIRKHLLY